MKKSFSESLHSFRSMSRREKLEHLRTYYLTDILIFLVFAVIIVYLLVVRFSRKEVFLGGQYGNVQLNEAGIRFAETEFFQKEDGNPRKQQIANESVLLTQIRDDEFFERNYYALSSVNARVGAQQVDYFVTDRIAMEIFMTQEMYLDLRTFFTDQELQAYESRLVYFAKADENGTLTEERYPVAINISDSVFAEEYLQMDSAGDVFFSVAVNSPNPERTRRFWEEITAIADREES